jgi:hypothetical protein
MSSPVMAVALQDAPRGQGQGGQDGGGNGGGRGRGGQDGGGGGGGRGGQGGGMGRGMFGGMGRGMGIQNQFRESFEPDFVRRDIPFFKEQLSLEEPQMIVVEQLMRDYEDAFEPAREDMMAQMQTLGQQMMAPMMGPEMQERWRGTMQKAREQMEQMAAEKGGELTPEERQAFFRDQMEKMGEEVRAEMKSSGAFDQMRASLGEIVTDFNKWQDTKSRMRKSFVDGMQASLSETQMKKWPAFERFLAREKTLPRSTISGEGVNLFFVLDEAGLSKETFAKMQPIMDEYELQLDAALKARNDFLAANEAKFLQSIQSGDQDAAKRFATRAMDLREGVRKVNDTYREQICAQLEPADAARVRAEALKVGFERVYGPSRVQRAFEAALALEGLDATVAEAVRTLQTQYANEVSPLNDRIAQEIRKEEPTRQVDEMVRVVGFMTGDVPMSQMFRRGGGNEATASGKLMDERGEINDTYMTRLEQLLTPEQREQLPRGGGRGGQGGFGMFGGGGPITLADMPEQARERMKEFDKNNDGTIDEKEREAMIAAFRERGGGMFGGGGGGGQGDGQGGGRGNRGGQGGGQGGGRGGQGGGQGQN